MDPSHFPTSPPINFKPPSQLLANKKDTEENERKPEKPLDMMSVLHAKAWARQVRRRRSLFEPERTEDDLGSSMLSHADFPSPRAKTSTTSSRKNVQLATFDREVIFGIVKEVLDQGLEGRSYDAKDTARLCHEIIRTVKERLSILNIPNYKLVCTCYITKKAKPSMKLESGCAWDEMNSTFDKDGFVEYAFQNEDLTAIGTVYGVYCERRKTKPKPILKHQRSFSLTQ